MSKLSSFFDQAAPWLVIGAVVTGPVWLFVVLFVLDGFGLFGGAPCVTEVRGRLSGLSGSDFEISETSCFHDPAVSVFVSKPGKRRKTLLFKYFPVHDGPYPAIAPIDARTVQISVPRVSSIVCRKDKWGALTIRYDIGGIAYPDSRAQPDDC